MDEFSGDVEKFSIDVDLGLQNLVTNMGLLQKNLNRVQGDRAAGSTFKSSRKADADSQITKKDSGNNNNDEQK